MAYGFKTGGRVKGSTNKITKEFQQALEKYGYEYTPPTEEEVRRFRLDSPFLHNEEDN